MSYTRECLQTLEGGKGGNSSVFEKKINKKKIAVMTVGLSVGIESSFSCRSVVQWVGSSLTYVEYQRSIPTEGKFFLIIIKL